MSSHTNPIKSHKELIIVQSTGDKMPEANP